MDLIKKMGNKKVLFLVAVIVYFMSGLWITHSRLHELDQAWENDGPQLTVAWQLRSRLAAIHWLGPLRPRPLTDPYRECGIPLTGGGWWGFLWRLVVASGRLTCLEERMAMARAQHEQAKGFFFNLFVMAAVGAVFVCSFVRTCPSSAWVRVSNTGEKNLKQ